MPTWRQLAVAASWVWCCAVVLSEGCLHQIATFGQRELGALLGEPERRLLVSNNRYNSLIDIHFYADGCNSKSSCQS